MGTLANGEVVAPFANAAMRLLREDWKGKYGSKMLAEELFPILQTGIPQPNQNFQNYITVNAGEDNKLALLIDKYGTPIYSIDAANGLQKIESPGYPPPKLKPKIVWSPKTITAGSAIGAGELDAAAVDPETGATIAGAYVYNPPSGTVFAAPGTATLYVDFAPTDGVKYRRSMGSTVLTITGGGGGGVFAFIDQDAAAVAGDSGGTASLTFPGTVAVGQLLLVALVCNRADDSTPLFNAPTDNLGNTYTLVETSTSGSPVSKLWMCVSAFSGSCTVTYTWDISLLASGDEVAGAILRYSGNHAAPVDSHVFANSSPPNTPITAWTTASIPVNNLGSLVVGVFSDGYTTFGTQSSGSFTPGAGQNLRCNVPRPWPGQPLYVVDKLPVDVATTLSGTTAFAASNVTIGASFKAA